MSDHDFNFAPPPPRRERKEFEPPPWEKDQFDRLAQERQAVDGAAVEPVTEATVVAEPSKQEVAEQSTPESTEAPAEKAPVEKRSPVKQATDEVKIAAMLFELQAQEVPATRGMNRVALVAGGMLVLIGLMLMVWAVVMVVVAAKRAETGRAGVVVGMMIFMFGAGFAGTGAWFVFRTLRLQGVL